MARGPCEEDRVRAPRAAAPRRSASADVVSSTAVGSPTPECSCSGTITENAPPTVWVCAFPSERLADPVTLAVERVPDPSARRVEDLAVLGPQRHRVEAAGVEHDRVDLRREVRGARRSARAPRGPRVGRRGRASCRRSSVAWSTVVLIARVAGAYAHEQRARDPCDEQDRDARSAGSSRSRWPFLVPAIDGPLKHDTNWSPRVGYRQCRAPQIQRGVGGYLSRTFAGPRSADARDQAGRAPGDARSCRR